MALAAVANGTVAAPNNPKTLDATALAVISALPGVAAAANDCMVI